MNNFGFVKVATAIPNVKVADCNYNLDHILNLVNEADKQNVKVLLFPELSLTAYTCADLFYQETLLNAAEDALKQLLVKTTAVDMVIVVGLPVRNNCRLFNCAAVCFHGKLLGLVPKSFMPSTNEFYEKRWFSPAAGLPKDASISFAGCDVPFGTDILFRGAYFTFAIEICEDLWLPQAPSYRHSLNGAQLILNLSASNEVIGKENYRKQLISQQSGKCVAAYAYAGAGFGESSTDLVFSGTAMIYENGSCLASSQRFSLDEQLLVADVDIQKLNADRMRSTAFFEQGNPQVAAGYQIVDFVFNAVSVEDVTRKESHLPFVPFGIGLNERCEEIFNIQVWGLATRLHHTGIKSAVIGISGGLDSTLALLVTVRTFDKLGLPRKNIVGITMPGFGTTKRTKNNSTILMEALGITAMEINIKDACFQHFKDIQHDAAILDVTYENTQARERTQILMDIANKCGGLVIGTGDLSELALGWCTYNGDHMSMYAVNTSIPKTLVRSLVKYVADNLMEGLAQTTLLDVVDTPVSPELLPADDKGEIAQKTEDIVGPYEIHDFCLYYMLRFGFSPSKIFFMAKKAFEGIYDAATLLKWMKTFYRRFFAQQFKRSCMPDGVKVGSVNLSPRGDWRMPSDASATLWRNELEAIML
ncbi:MAG: NAD(+) synthase [Bacteroidales bacterium]|nr:NAD(+) synthase [Candidatus Physcocola equi]